jgi:hypothetical protein
MGSLRLGLRGFLDAWRPKQTKLKSILSSLDAELQTVEKKARSRGGSMLVRIKRILDLNWRREHRIFKQIYY